MDEELESSTLLKRTMGTRDPTVGRAILKSQSSLSPVSSCRASHNLRVYSGVDSQPDPKPSSVRSTKLQMMMPSKRLFLGSTHRVEVPLPPIKSRAVTQAKSEKPVVVSMGGVAASGGYYVSAAADAIFAEETTITGSIGVYSGKFNAHTLLQYLKINVESEDHAPTPVSTPPSKAGTSLNALNGRASLNPPTSSSKPSPPMDGV